MGKHKSSKKAKKSKKSDKKAKKELEKAAKNAIAKDPVATSFIWIKMKNSENDDVVAQDEARKHNEMMTDYVQKVTKNEIDQLQLEEPHKLLAIKGKSSDKNIEDYETFITDADGNKIRKKSKGTDNDKTETTQTTDDMEAAIQVNVNLKNKKKNVNTQAMFHVHVNADELKGKSKSKNKATKEREALENEGPDNSPGNVLISTSSIKQIEDKKLNGERVAEDGLDIKASTGSKKKFPSKSKQSEEEDSDVTDLSSVLNDIDNTRNRINGKKNREIGKNKVNKSKSKEVLQDADSKTKGMGNLEEKRVISNKVSGEVFNVAKCDPKVRTFDGNQDECRDKENIGITVDGMGGLKYQSKSDQNIESKSDVANKQGNLKDEGKSSRRKDDGRKEERETDSYKEKCEKRKKSKHNKHKHQSRSDIQNFDSDIRDIVSSERHTCTATETNDESTTNLSTVKSTNKRHKKHKKRKETDVDLQHYTQIDIQTSRSKDDRSGDINTRITTDLFVQSQNEDDRQRKRSKSGVNDVDDLSKKPSKSYKNEIEIVSRVQVKSSDDRDRPQNKAIDEDKSNVLPLSYKSDETEMTDTTEVSKKKRQKKHKHHSRNHKIDKKESSHGKLNDINKSENRKYEEEIEKSNKLKSKKSEINDKSQSKGIKDQQHITPVEISDPNGANNLRQNVSKNDESVNKLLEKEKPKQISKSYKSDGRVKSDESIDNNDGKLDKSQENKKQKVFENVDKSFLREEHSVKRYSSKKSEQYELNRVEKIASERNEKSYKKESEVTKRSEKISTHQSKSYRIEKEEISDGRKVPSVNQENECKSQKYIDGGIKQEQKSLNRRSDVDETSNKGKIERSDYHENVGDNININVGSDEDKNEADKKEKSKSKKENDASGRHASREVKRKTSIDNMSDKDKEVSTSIKSGKMDKKNEKQEPLEKEIVTSDESKPLTSTLELIEELKENGEKELKVDNIDKEKILEQSKVSSGTELSGSRCKSMKSIENEKYKTVEVKASYSKDKLSYKESASKVSENVEKTQKVVKEGKSSKVFESETKIKKFDELAINENIALSLTRTKSHDVNKSKKSSSKSEMGDKSQGKHKKKNKKRETESSKKIENRKVSEKEDIIYLNESISIESTKTGNDQNEISNIERSKKYTKNIVTEKTSESYKKEEKHHTKSKTREVTSVERVEDATGRQSNSERKHPNGKKDIKIQEGSQPLSLKSESNEFSLDQNMSDPLKSQSKKQKTSKHTKVSEKEDERYFNENFVKESKRSVTEVRSPTKNQRVTENDNEKDKYNTEIVEKDRDNKSSKQTVNEFTSQTKVSTKINTNDDKYTNETGIKESSKRLTNEDMKYASQNKNVDENVDRKMIDNTKQKESVKQSTNELKSHHSKNQVQYDDKGKQNRSEMQIKEIPIISTPMSDNITETNSEAKSKKTTRTVDNSKKTFTDEQTTTKDKQRKIFENCHTDEKQESKKQRQDVASKTTLKQGENNVQKGKGTSRDGEDNVKPLKIKQIESYDQTESQIKSDPKSQTIKSVSLVNDAKKKSKDKKTNKDKKGVEQHEVFVNFKENGSIESIESGNVDNNGKRTKHAIKPGSSEHGKFNLIDAIKTMNETKGLKHIKTVQKTERINSTTISRVDSDQTAPATGQSYKIETDESSQISTTTHIQIENQKKPYASKNKGITEESKEDKTNKSHSTSKKSAADGKVEKTISNEVTLSNGQDFSKQEHSKSSKKTKESKSPSKKIPVYTINHEKNDYNKESQTQNRKEDKNSTPQGKGSQFTDTKVCCKESGIFKNVAKSDDSESVDQKKNKDELSKSRRKSSQSTNSPDVDQKDINQKEKTENQKENKSISSSGVQNQEEKNESTVKSEDQNSVNEDSKGQSRSGLDDKNAAYCKQTDGLICNDQTLKGSQKEFEKQEKELSPKRSKELSPRRSKDSQPKSLTPEPKSNKSKTLSLVGKESADGKSTSLKEKSKGSMSQSKSGKSGSSNAIINKGPSNNKGKQMQSKSPPRTGNQKKKNSNISEKSKSPTKSVNKKKSDEKFNALNDIDNDPDKVKSIELSSQSVNLSKTPPVIEEKETLSHDSEVFDQEKEKSNTKLDTKMSKKNKNLGRQKGNKSGSQKDDVDDNEQQLSRGYGPPRIVEKESTCKTSSSDFMSGSDKDREKGANTSWKTGNTALVRNQMMPEQSQVKIDLVIEITDPDRADYEVMSQQIIKRCSRKSSESRRDNSQNISRKMIEAGIPEGMNLETDDHDEPNDEAGNVKGSQITAARKKGNPPKRSTPRSPIQTKATPKVRDKQTSRDTSSQSTPQNRVAAARKMYSPGGASKSEVSMTTKTVENKTSNLSRTSNQSKELNRVETIQKSSPPQSPSSTRYSEKQKINKKYSDLPNTIKSTTSPPKQSRSPPRKPTKYGKIDENSNKSRTPDHGLDYNVINLKNTDSNTQSGSKGKIKSKESLESSKVDENIYEQPAVIKSNSDPSATNTAKEKHTKFPTLDEMHQKHGTKPSKRGATRKHHHHDLSDDNILSSVSSGKAKKSLLSGNDDSIRNTAASQKSQDIFQSLKSESYASAEIWNHEDENSEESKPGTTEKHVVKSGPNTSGPSSTEPSARVRKDKRLRRERSAPASRKCKQVNSHEPPARCKTSNSTVVSGKKMGWSETMPSTESFALPTKNLSLSEINKSSIYQGKQKGFQRSQQDAAAKNQVALDKSLTKKPLGHIPITYNRFQIDLYKRHKPRFTKRVNQVQKSRTISSSDDAKGAVK